MEVGQCPLHCCLGSRVNDWSASSHLGPCGDLVNGSDTPWSSIPALSFLNVKERYTYALSQLLGSFMLFNDEPNSFFFFNLFWLCRVSVAACGLLSCSMHAGSSSPTRDRTQVPCIGSVESLPTGPPVRSQDELNSN